MLGEGGSIQFNLKSDSSTEESLRPPVISVGVSTAGMSPGEAMLRVRATTKNGKYHYQASCEIRYRVDEFYTYNIAIGSIFDEANEQDLLFVYY
jgi:hypothetical protein